MEQFKGTLTERGIGEDDALFPTDEAAVVLIKAINAHFGTDLKPVFIQAFAGEHPPYAMLEAEIGSRPAVIWDQLGHYEALVLRGS